jgi:hypothetical protein
VAGEHHAPGRLRVQRQGQVAEDVRLDRVRHAPEPVVDQPLDRLLGPRSGTASATGRRGSLCPSCPWADGRQRRVGRTRWKSPGSDKEQVLARRAGGPGSARGPRSTARLHVSVRPARKLRNVIVYRGRPTSGILCSRSPRSQFAQRFLTSWSRGWSPAETRMLSPIFGAAGLGGVRIQSATERRCMGSRDLRRAESSARVGNPCHVKAVPAARVQRQAPRRKRVAQAATQGRTAMLDLPLGNRRDQNRQGVTRRDFVRAGALGAFGLSLPGFLATGARAGTPPSAGTAVARSSPASVGSAPRAKSVLLVFLGGGLSHLDTFDPKPGAAEEVRGKYASIPTSVTGLRVGELLPRMARTMDKVCLVRSQTHESDHHEAATNWVLSGPARVAVRGPPVDRRGRRPRDRVRRPAAPAVRRDPEEPVVQLGPGHERVARRAVRVGRGRRPERRGVSAAGGRDGVVGRRPRRVRRRRRAGRPAGPVRPDRVRPGVPAGPPADRAGRAVRPGELRRVGPPRRHLVRVGGRSARTSTPGSRP